LSNGIRLNSSSNNLLAQNAVDSNASWGIYIEGTSVADTFSKNNWRGQPIGPAKDSAVFIDIGLGKFDFKRNWWDTTDSSILRNRINPASRDSVIYHPFRLGIVDTSLNADTVAPKAPDTVTATAIDSTRIRIDWTTVLISEESETNLNVTTYYVYRSPTRDTSLWILRAPSTTPTFTDSGLTAGQSFFYRVTTEDNHSPYPNQSFFSDSIPADTTPSANVTFTAVTPSAGPIARAVSVNADSTIFSISISGAGADTISSITISLLGSNIPDTDVDTIAFWRDGNRNGIYETNQDTFIVNMTSAGNGNYLASNPGCTILTADSFLFTLAFEDTASFADTFTVRLPAGGVVLASAGNAPGAPLNLSGIWSVNSGVDTSIANIWYVNDSSTTGDSFTAAVGAAYYNGLTIVTPARHITQVTPFLTPGDTIYVDAGTFDSYVALSASETAAVHIDTNAIWLIGKDSNSTIIDPPGAKNQIGLIGIHADTQTALTIRNLAVTGSYNGIRFYNVDASTITGDSLGSNGNCGILLMIGSDTNTITNNISSSNNFGGVGYGVTMSASSNNTVSGNALNSNGSFGVEISSNSAGNIVTDNFCSSNTQSGFSLTLGSSNLIARNVANSNLQNGIDLFNSSGNRVINNTFNGNTRSGIRINSASSNTIHQNEINSNETGVHLLGSSSGNTISKNNVTSNIINHIYDQNPGAETLARNWYGTTDSAAILAKFGDTAATFLPFRLGLVDTAPLADTVAPKAPDTVTATAIDSTRIRIDWTAVITSEEVETTVGLNGYRVYRSATSDTGLWILRADVGPATATFTDSQLTPAATWYYRVTSVDNHAPFENQSFFSDSVAGATTNGLVIQPATPATVAGVISRTGPESAVFAISMSSGATDTITSLSIRLTGALPFTDVDTVDLYRDGNRNGSFEPNQDTVVANIGTVNGDTWSQTGLTIVLGATPDSFLFTVTLEDTANFADTFQVILPANGVSLASAGPGPNAPIVQSGVWTVNPGVDTTGPNVWYVNDSSTVGDSFTATTGAPWYNGLTIQTPKRSLNDIEALLTPGDTVYVDAGTYLEPDTVSIAQSSIWIIGKDSAATVIDFNNTTSGGARAIYGSGLTQVVLRNFQVTRGFNGIWWTDVDTSTIAGVRSHTNGDRGVFITTGATGNVLQDVWASSNVNDGIYLNIAGAIAITGGLSSSNAGNGLLLASCDDARVTRFRSVSNSQSGFSLSGNTQRARLTANTALDNLQTGFDDAGNGNDNLFLANVADSNAGYQFRMSASALGPDTFRKNIILPSPGNPDSGVAHSAALRVDFTRNWWNTTDSGAIRNRIWGAGRDSVVYLPFRLGIVDTAPLADTVAPKAPDTVTATAVDSTRIRIDWTAVVSSEEVETTVGLSGYRVYRSATPDTGLWILRSDVGPATATFTDSQIANGATWYYRVTAFDNHTPNENQSFFSDSVPFATTFGLVLQQATPATTAGVISRTGPESTVMAVSISAGSADVITDLAIRLIGNLPSSDVDTVAIYRDGNRNGAYEANQDTLQATINTVTGDTWSQTGLSLAVSATGDSFLFVVALEDTANFADTFQVSVPALGIALSGAGAGPDTIFSQVGTWSVNPGVDTTGPNVWYVNDSSTVGDSFTATAGAPWYNGLTIQTPFRTINQAEPFLTAGDTILIDSGYYYEADTFRIETNSVYMTGVDSQSTIIQIGDSSVASGFAIFARNATRITMRDFRVIGGFNGVLWSNVDTSSIVAVRAENSGGFGINLDSLSSGDTAQNCVAIGNSLRGFRIAGNQHYLANNSALANGSDGFLLVSAGTNNLLSNTSQANTGAGFSLTATSFDNVLASNLSQNNGGDGFSMASLSSGNRLRGNTARNNSGAGFSSTTSNNLFVQNASDSNFGYAFSATGTGDTYQKNILIMPPARPDSGLFAFSLTNVEFTRNWFGTTDTILIKAKIWGQSRDSVIYTPFRLGIPDTTAGSDSVAPRASDSVLAAAQGPTTIRITWAAVGTSEEPELVTGLNGYRVYRAANPTDSDWTLLGQTIPATPVWDDTTVAPSTTRYYRVTSIDGSSPINQSFYSDSIASATTTADTLGPNVWYVNDTSASGDSFTSAIGDTNNLGLSPSSPKLNLNQIEPFLTAGDTVYVDVGVFPEPDTFQIDTNSVWIIGVDSQSTIINFNNPTVGGARAIHANSKTNITIRNLRVVNAYRGVYWRNVDNSSLETVAVTGSGEAGVYLEIGSDTNRLTAVSSTGNGGDGIGLSASLYNTLTRCLASGNTFDGFFIASTSFGNILTNNTASGNTVHGFNLATTSNGNSLAGNLSSGNLQNGIEITTQNNDIRNNVIRDNGMNGIRVTGNNNFISQNTIDSNADFAIALTSTANGDTIEKNVLIMSPTRPDSGISNATTNRHLATRNWWNTIDSGVIRARTWPVSARDSVTYLPFRLGIVDTTAGADTTAPDSPDTVVVTALGQNQLRVSWSNVTVDEEANGGAFNITGYKVYRSPTPDTTLWILRAVVGTTPQRFDDSGLAAFESMYYRIVSFDNATYVNASFFSDSVAGARTSDTTPPTAPSLLAPATPHDTNQTTIRFEWTASVDTQSGLLNYTLQIDTVGTFGTPFVDSGTKLDTFGIRTFVTSETLYWRVIAYDTAGNPAVTPSRILRVDTTPPIPGGIVTPTMNSYTSTTVVSFSWASGLDTGTGIAYYRFQLDTSGVFAASLVDTTTTTTALTISTLAANDTYYWRVTNYDSATNFATVGTRVFGIDTTSPQSFATMLPTANADTNATTITFVWNSSADSISGLKDYRLQIDTANTFVSLYVDSIVSPLANSTNRTLAANDTYFWRILAVDTADNQQASDTKRLRIDTGGPSIASPSTPTDSHETNVVSINFTWSAASAVTGISHYRLQIDTATNFAAPFVDSIAAGTNGTRTLPANDTYRWRIIAVDNAANTSSSSSRMLLVDTAGPNGIVTLVSPTSNADTNLTTVVFSWSGGSDALSGLNGYRLQIDTSSSFITPIVDSFTPLTTAARTLAANDTYYWRLLSVDDATNTAASSANLFRLDTDLPSIPSPIQPPNNHDTMVSPVTFSWTASTDALSGVRNYRFQIATDTGFTTIIRDSFTTATTETHAFSVNDTYYWRVKAIDTATNAATSGSRILRFDDSAPSAPTLQGPEANHDTNRTSITFSWLASADSGSGISGYRLQVDTATGFAAPFIDSFTTALTATRALLANDTFQWRVIAVDISLNTGASASRVLRVDTTNPSVPTLTNPPNGYDTNVTPGTLTWTASIDTGVGLRHYRVQLDTAPSFAVPLVDSTTTNTFFTSGVPRPDSYYWRIIAIDSATNAETSSTRLFRFDTGGPSAPSLVAPGAGHDTANTAVTFTWSASTALLGVSHYRLQIDTTAAFTAPFVDSTTPLTSGARTLGANDTYFWRVIAVDSGSNTAPSASQRLRVDTTPPTAPTLSVLADGAETNATTLTFSWIGSADLLTGVKYYRFRVDTDPLFGGTLVDSNTGTSTTAIVTLAANDTYYWLAIAVDSAENTTPAASGFLFRIDTRPPALFSALQPPAVHDTTATAVVFQWSASADTGTGLAGYRLQIDTANTFTSLLYNSFVTGTSTGLSGIPANDTYYWRVVAFDTATNQTALASRLLRIDTAPPSTVTQLLPPANADTNVTSITFSWTTSADSVSGVASYRLQIDTTLAFSAPSVDTTLTLTAVTIINSRANDTYFWRVFTADSAGNTSVSASRMNRIDTAPPTTPLLIAPAPALDTNSLTILFSWSASTDSLSGLNNYKLQVDTFGTFVAPNVISTLSTTASMTLKANETYVWRVIANDTATNPSASETRILIIDTTALPVSVAVHPTLPAGTNINPVGVDLTGLVSVSIVGDTQDTLTALTTVLSGNAGSAANVEALTLYRDVNRDASLDTGVDTALTTFTYVSGQTYRASLSWLIGAGDSFIVAVRLRDTITVGDTVRAQIPALGIKTEKRDSGPTQLLSAAGTFTASYSLVTIVSVDQTKPANGSITAVDADRTVIMVLSVAGGTAGDTLNRFFVSLAGNAGASAVVDSLALYKDGNENGTFEPGLDTLAAVLPYVSGTLFGSSALSVELPAWKSGADSFLVIVSLRDTATAGDTLRATIPTTGVGTQLRDSAPANSAASPATFTVTAAVTTLLVDALRPTGGSISPAGSDLTAVLAATIGGAANDSLASFAVTFEGVAGTTLQVDTVFLYRDVDKNGNFASATDALVAMLSPQSSTTHRLTTPFSLGASGIDSFVVVVSIRDTVAGGDTLRAYIPTLSVKSSTRDTVPGAAQFSPATFLTESGVSTIVKIAVNPSTVSETIAPLNVDLTRIMSLTIQGAPNDTLMVFKVRLQGGAGQVSRLDYITLFKDINKNGNFDSGTDPIITLLAWKGGATQDYEMTNIKFSLGVTGQESFLVVISVKDSAPSGETVLAVIPANSVKTSLKDTGSVIAISAPAAFTIFDLNPPNAFTLATPAQNHETSVATVTVTWNASSDPGSGLGSYKVQMSRTLAFSTLVVDTSTGLARSLSVALSGNDSYYWRAIAYDVNGNSRTSTDTRLFRIDLNAPTRPTPTAPPANHDTTATTVAFSFTGSTDTGSGLLRYRLQVATDAGFTAVTIDSSTALALGGTRAFVGSQTVYWRIAAQDTAGNLAYSDTRRLTIIGSGPTAPALVEPTAGTETKTVAIRFSWNASTDSVSTVTGYRVQADTAGAFLSSVLDTTVAGTTVTATLPANLAYTWKVTASNAAGLTTASATRTFKIDTIVTVSLFSPPDGTNNNDTTPTFVWTSDGDTFLFQLASETATPTIVLSSAQAATSFQPGGSLAGGAYFWRVIARDTALNHDTSAWRALTIDTGVAIVDTVAPAVFALLTPAHATFVGSSAVIFQWALTTDTPGGIAGYRVQIALDSAFAPALYDSTVGAAVDTFTATLNGNQGYYWRVIAFDGDSNQTVSLTTRFVTTDTTRPTAPAPLIAPASGVDTAAASITFRWSASTDTGSGLSHYVVQAETAGTFVSPVFNETTTLTLRTFTGFTQDTWSWRVAAVDIAGNVSTWVSDTFRMLSTPPSIPAPVSPMSGAFTSTTTVSFDWTDAANLGSPLRRYILNASTDSTFASILVDTQTSDTTSATTIGGFVAGTWYWRVAAEDTVGNVSAFSSTANFRIETSPAPTPAISSPTHGLVAAGATMSFSWSASGAVPASGINGYQIEIRRAADSAVHTDSFVLSSATVASVTLNAFGETAYVVQIRARTNAGTFGPYSASRAFGFDSTPPSAAPTAVSPKNGASTTATAVQFRVTGVTDTGLASVIRYRFQTSRTESFAAVLATILNVDSSVVFTPNFLFTDSGTWFWRVAAVDSVGNTTPYGTAESFVRPPPPDTVPPLSPSDLQATADNNLGITLTWRKSPSDDMDSGGQYNIYWNGGSDSALPDTLFKIVAHSSAESYAYSTLADTILRNGTFYRFKVRAQDNSGNEDRNDVIVGTTARSAAAALAYAVIFNPDAGRKLERAGGIQVMAELLGGFRNSAETITFQFRPLGGGGWWTMRPSTSAASINPRNIITESRTIYGMHWDAVTDTTVTDTLYEIRALVTNRSGETSGIQSLVNVVELKSTGSSDSEQRSAGATDSSSTDRQVDSRRSNQLDLLFASDSTASIELPEDSLNPTTDTTQGTARLEGRPARRSGAGGLAVGSGAQNEIDAAIGKDTPIGMALTILLPGGQSSLLNGKAATVALSYPALNASGFIPGTNARPESLVMRAASAGDADSRVLTIVSIDTINRMITATTTRFSTFLLVVPNPGSGGPGNQASLAGFMVYPNPYRPNDGNASTGKPFDAANPRTTGIVFDNLTGRVKVEVFTLRGERVFERTTAVNDGYVTWNVKNSNNGDDLASGYYIYIVTDVASGQRVTGKLAVIR
jgi:parallel beta-helix repeat protein